MITDTLASIHTSCDVAAGAVFGPCDPQHATLGDSITFIALRCSDRRAGANYAYQVDTSAPSVAVVGPVWLWLVRSARNTEEQNLEAYVKDGHLFYRALQNISKEAELLVWYSKDLTKLLGLTPALKGHKGYRCSYCKQSFLSEFPARAHQRFLCSERLRSSCNSKSNSSKAPMEFQALSRNLENITSTLRDSGSGSVAKRRHSVDSESGESQESPFSGSHAHPPLKRLCAPLVKRKLSSVSSTQSGRDETSISNEGGHSLRWATSCQDNCNASLIDVNSKANRNQTGPHYKSHARGSLSATTSSDLEEQPSHSIPQISNLTNRAIFSPGIALTLDSTTFPSMLTAKTTIPHYSSTLFNKSLLKQQTLVFSSKPWSKIPKSPQTQINTEWSLLPAALSPLGLSAQNWCAKCSITFHTTSDLVQHMRSHHKRSAGQLRGHTEEKLKCPICDEGFRERHHLSRHMSSHTQ
ncbi:zinc finger protein 488 [Hoplias malabaricus]|uniref:zinc finger protein 488 n=1 Tax=Hoplias malabaricus TaxID=27720 RepID=UPI003462ACF7